MSRVREVLEQGNDQELWQMCCGFIDLSIEKVMEIQNSLMLEQLKLLSESSLGQKLLRGNAPETIAEFRETVPLTTYRDYCPELLNQMEDTLPAKSILWQHTSGRSGEYPFKWIPMSARYREEFEKVMMATAIFSSCKKRGDVSKIKEHAKILYALAPRPYASGTFAHIIENAANADFLPPLEEAEKMGFEERIKDGLMRAMGQGFNFFFGLSLALVAVGEMFQNNSGSLNIKSLLSRPKALGRILKGYLKSKILRRKLLPRDIWTLSGIMSGGTDSAVLKHRIKELWGRYPLDVYASTEGCVIAAQTWDYEGMTFFPNLNYIEFIPEVELVKWRLNHDYIPKTLLLNEVKAEENYEVVISNFHGGALLRYRTGDLVQITSLHNVDLKIDLPQMTFVGRVDDVIDLAGYVRVTERTLWQAIENSGIAYQDWVVIKEVSDKPMLHLYLELKKRNGEREDELALTIWEEIKKMDQRINSAGIFKTLEDIVGTIPIKLSLLPQGAFASYITQRLAEGADLAHIKPPHMTPPSRVLELLGARVPAERVKVAAT